MQTKQVEIEKAICIKCGKEYWATAEYKEITRIDPSKSLCIQCDEPYLMEDDASEEFDYIEPEIENR